MVSEFFVYEPFTDFASDVCKKLLRKRIDEWLRVLLLKLERNTSRTEKCRLLASVERHELIMKWKIGAPKSTTKIWIFCKFIDNHGIIYDANKKELERFESTVFQEYLLSRNPVLKNVVLDRFDIKEET
jgi:hypothetical protein